VIEWDLNYNQTVPETNYNNDSTLDRFTATGGAPVLAISALRSYLKTAPGGGGIELMPPAVSQSVYPTLDWQVTGNPSSLSVTERALLDGNALCSCTANIVAGSTYLSSCSQGWAPTAGAHTLRWDLDYSNTVTAAASGKSASVTFTPAAAGGPVLSGLAPSTVPANSGAFTLTVTGTNFASGAVVQWNGAALNTTYVGNTQLTAAVPANLVTTSGKVAITVVNPGGEQSASAIFLVQ
jgi:hypothetical protein